VVRVGGGGEEEGGGEGEFGNQKKSCKEKVKEKHLAK